MDRPLRVLMVSPQFRPIVGGYERAAERLAEGLVASGHSVEVVAERRQLSWPRYEISRGVIIRRIPSLFYRGIHTLTSTISLMIFLLVQGRRFDLFHVHQYGRAAAVTSAVGLILGRPVFLKLTNTGRHGLDATLPNGPIGSILRWLHGRVSCCVVTSQRALQEARDFGFSAERICLVPNPLETDLFQPAPEALRSQLRQELGMDTRFTAVCAARLNSEKNHAMLIRAWSLFADGNEDVQLIILGDGPLRDEVRQLASSSAGSASIRMLGPVSDPLRWYQAADVYVLSSDVEGLSNSLLEALSAGLAVISTRVSGSEDIFGVADVGEILAVGDHEAMARALLVLQADPQRRARCGLAARQYAVDHHSLVTITGAMERCYRRHSAV